MLPLAADFAGFAKGFAYENIPRPFLPLAPAAPAVPAGLGTTGGGGQLNFPGRFFLGGACGAAGVTGLLGWCGKNCSARDVPDVPGWDPG